MCRWFECARYGSVLPVPVGGDGGRTRGSLSQPRKTTARLRLRSTALGAQFLRLHWVSKFLPPTSAGAQIVLSKSRSAHFFSIFLFGIHALTSCHTSQTRAPRLGATPTAVRQGARAWASAAAAQGAAGCRVLDFVS